MTWEASLTTEAWQHAYKDIFALERGAIIDALRCDGDLSDLAHLPTGTLASELWVRVCVDIRTTTNGGWELYLCPSGCHTIPIR